MKRSRQTIRRATPFSSSHQITIVLLAHLIWESSVQYEYALAFQPRIPFLGQHRQPAFSSLLFSSPLDKEGPRAAGDDSINNGNEVSQSSDDLDDGFLLFDEWSSLSNLPVCRVVASADGKLPEFSSDLLPEKSSVTERKVFDKLDSIFHAVAHDGTRRLRYNMETTATSTLGNRNSEELSADEEQAFVSTTRRCLEDAGFQLLSPRDLDLCDALNAGYLLRLSIQPNLKQLDPSIRKEFYPELFNDDGSSVDPESALFDGRVLVYWRGYDAEVSKGRLLLPKIDYLQASLVQGAASWLKGKFDALERAFYVRYLVTSRKVARAFWKFIHRSLDRIPDERISSTIRKQIRTNSTNFAGISTKAQSPGNIIKLYRYGGSKARSLALAPFVICEDESGTCIPPGVSSSESQSQRVFHGLDGDISGRDVDHDIYKSIKDATAKCQYDVDAERRGRITPPSELLERITLGNLVDFFSKRGRRHLLKAIVSKSELVEPTYKEVVVVWRPLPERNESLPQVRPPKFVYDFADMFDIEGLPPTADDLPSPERPRAQIRSFSNVPMANLLADAFVFDLVSAVSLLAVLGSLRFDSPRLDLFAILTVSFWIIRTVIRYSNKLARYDLLVQTFLTRKLTHRNAGALKYIASEAGSQRATRATLVHAWLSRRKRTRSRNSDEGLQSPEGEKKETLTVQGEQQIRNWMHEERQVRIDMNAALKDLQDVGLIFSDDDNRVQVKDYEADISSSLQHAWNQLLEQERLLAPSPTLDIKTNGASERDSIFAE